MLPDFSLSDVENQVPDGVNNHWIDCLSKNRKAKIYAGRISALVIYYLYFRKDCTTHPGIEII